jgi:hypothetical protein
MGIADISYNERTGSTEIVHTYTAHDLATLLTNLYGRQFDLGRADSEAPLRRYVEKQFYPRRCGPPAPAAAMGRREGGCRQWSSFRNAAV